MKIIFSVVVAKLSILFKILVNFVEHKHIHEKYNWLFMTRDNPLRQYIWIFHSRS